MSSEQTKRKSSFKRFILISFILGILVGAIAFVIVSPYIFDFLKKESIIKTPPVAERQKKESYKRASDTERTNKEIKATEIQSDSSMPQIKTILEENSQLLEETDQLIANIEEFISDFPETPENAPLEVIDVETYYTENAIGQIAKDRLASIKKYKLPLPDEHNLKIDSLLLGKHISNPKNVLSVEFWYSPMNYSGYRYQSGRLVLFGVPDIENINFLYKNKKLIYISEVDTIFIKETEDFIPINYTRQKNDN